MADGIVTITITITVCDSSYQCGMITHKWIDMFLYLYA